MTEQAMLAFATPMLERALQKGARLRLKGAEVTCPEEIAPAVARCWHDCLSDLDVEVWGLTAHDMVQDMQLFGTSVQGNVLRLVTQEGFRADIICQDQPVGMETPDTFWFVAVQALGKLLRRDHLIAAHLAHMLLMETLVDQMVLRDKAKGTNHHRYGDAEELSYLLTDAAPWADLLRGGETYSHIAQMLVQAALCRSGAETFFAIWRNYLKEMNA